MSPCDGMTVAQLLDDKKIEANETTYDTTYRPIFERSEIDISSR